MEQSAAYEGQQVYHPKGWWGHYVFSQDHKIIALQYTCVALAIGLTGMFLSMMMRMQLGFPGLFDYIVFCCLTSVTGGSLALRAVSPGKRRMQI